MEYKTIDDVYAANASIREKFKGAFATMTKEQLNAHPPGDEWSVAQIVEHVAIVNDGALRICAKLLGKAEAAGKTNDGSVLISPEFIEAASSAVGRKLEAPEMVRPINNLSVADSVAKLDELQLSSVYESSSPSPANGQAPAATHLAATPSPERLAVRR